MTVTFCAVDQYGERRTISVRKNPDEQEVLDLTLNLRTQLNKGERLEVIHRGMHK